MTLRDDLLPVLDSIRAIPADLGLHQFTVTRVTLTWASGRVGEGASVSTETLLQVAGRNVHARKLDEDEAKRVLRSGELWEQGDWTIGPVTPEFPGGGYAAGGFDAAAGIATQIFYRVDGPGIPSGGRYFAAIGKRTDTPLGYRLHLRRANQEPRG